ncbi:SRPBCC family protein [Actinomadura sp. 21ATH]|uniref:SRPBCC family protein n=1 Tax=Actinomadura sp. 21ATH TaxID=1735444 RepID=UPI0035C1AAA9
MADFADALGAVEREVVRDEKTVLVRLRRGYDAAVEDVWSALTDPARLSRWFMPVGGDLREGGTFSVQGEPMGRILECAPPDLLRFTYGAETSVVEVRLESAAGGTDVLLEHSVPLEFAQSGAGSLNVGPGWDIAYLGLGLHLAGEEVGDPMAWEGSLPVQRYAAGTVDAWTGAAKGTATEDEIAGAAAAARAHFAPDLEGGGQAGSA